jgi:hypothetical protein
LGAAFLGAAFLGSLVAGKAGSIVRGWHPKSSGAWSCIIFCFVILDSALQIKTYFSQYDTKKAYI